ncbi:hypothetical protein OsI_23247 [Oryza sativa Indica Group]|uniref:Uncharacterized protein n=1 Tax=Oryza sativa subsp. indica TaxID=39946 RepID=A2YDR0_ORYSI|nr:hypothetical protein OsI_23247 [Oryza sativa Indica Group]
MWGGGGGYSARWQGGVFAVVRMDLGGGDNGKGSWRRRRGGVLAAAGTGRGLGGGGGGAGDRDIVPTSRAQRRCKATMSWHKGDAHVLDADISRVSSSA